MKSRRVFAKRVLGCVLSLGLIAGSIAGCGKNTGKDANLVDKVGKISKDYVFKSEKMDLGENNDYNYLSMVGDRVYASTYSKKGSIIIKSFNTDGGDVKEISIPEADNESHGYLTFDNDGNFYAIYQIYADMYSEEDPHTLEEGQEEEGVAHAGDDNGEASTQEADAGAASGAEASAAVSADAGAQEASDAAGSADSAGSDNADAATSSESAIDTDPEELKRTTDYSTEQPGEDQMYLVKYDNTGKELFRIDLKEGLSEDEYFSMFKMIYTEEFGLITSSNYGVRILDDNSKTFKTIVDTKDEKSEFYEMTLSLYNGFNGKIYASCWGDNGLELRSFDPATGKFGEPSSRFSDTLDCTFFEGKGYDLYVSKSDGVYGYDANRDVLEKLFDYADSDINVNYAVGTIVAVTDLEFIANLPDEENKYTLCKLTKVPADQVKDRTVITFAGNMIDYNARQKVYQFNQENTDYKIKVVDYGTLNNSDDWDAGYNQFNMDIASGNTPDIMFFSQDEPVDSYINKGLFIDLSTYLKNDPELKETEFVESVFNAYKTGDKMYMLVPSFYVNTVSAKTSLLKGNETLTIKDCEDIIEAKGLSYLDAWGLITQETALNYGLMTSGNTFIDWENKKCNFDSDAFIELLEFVKKFPTEISDDAWQEHDDMAYMKDESLFSTTYLNSFRTYRRTRDGEFAADISFIGFPNSTGTNMSVISPVCRFAISAKSKYADVCWEFLRQFYMEDYQDKLAYEFPIRKSSYDKQALESMDRPYWIDEDGKKQYEDDYVYAGMEQIKINPLNEQDVKFVKDFIDSLHFVYSPNQNVNNIIMEEASAFFSGQKSAKEVADIIQSRLTIYVNENS